MSDVLAAFRTHWAGDTTLDDISGPWLGKVPTDAAQTYPYAQITEMAGSARPKMHFGALYMEDVLLMVRVFDDEPETVQTYQAAIHARFDKQTFTIGSGRVLSCLRQQSFTDYAGKDGTDTEIYMAVVVYRVTVQRSF